ncbi:putative endo-beta-1,4-glucanase D [Glarea lozoyensis 74030]|uniref:AA9 family lytic polysaccharide monooxygenase n=1 Tax=Glarea lozoyensis (strain ATCC 74030 / MF5533) TaxID=1104152 RepID=H0EVU1_GLAL7|nr:putative endo-beta-1,4-glucanase D [Glarea lozoyensis 74030]
MVKTAAVVAVANAHTTIWNAFVDGVDQGVGNSAAGYIRSPPNNNPVKDITSSAMTCNVNNVATAKTIDVAAGSKVTIEWHHDSNSASDDIIDSSHKGPVMAYIAPTASNGAGDVWVKLAEAGLSGGKWAVETLIANKGKHDVTIPAGLAPGKYLLRGEIIALHESDVAYNVNPARGAQFYMECIQINVTGAGATTLPAGVAIPGTYKYTDPGVVFNLYGGATSYTIPGPAVWDGKTGGAAAPAPVASSTAAVKPTTAAPVATSAPVVVKPTTVAAPVATSVSSAVIVPIASSAVVAPPAATAAPASSTKDSCKSKTTAAAVSTKDSCKSKTSAVVAPTTLQTVAVPAPSKPAAAGVAMYGQCGGQGFTGSTTCAAGTCTVMNPYYSQCI